MNDLIQNATPDTTLIIANQVSHAADPSRYAIMPVIDIEAAFERRKAVVEYTQRMLKAGSDYGVIPGTGEKSKRTLLKPGAEKLASLFGLSTHFDLLEREYDWIGRDHNGEPFFFIQYRCTLTRGDLVAGQGIGSCNSWEKKYRYRTVYANKATEGEKAAGRLETRSGRNGSYQVYVIPNPDPADQVNTVDKMAQKRALVAAVLIAVNASELFEDTGDVVEGDWHAADPEPARKPKAAKEQPAKRPDNVDPDGVIQDGPEPEDEMVIREAPVKEFLTVAAANLSTDVETISTRFRELGYSTLPGKPQERVNAYRKLKAAVLESQSNGEVKTP